jgi:hypothetical protein
MVVASCPPPFFHLRDAFSLKDKLSSMPDGGAGF